eukprot:UN32814
MLAHEKICIYNKLRIKELELSVYREIETNDKKIKLQVENRKRKSFCAIDPSKPLGGELPPDMRPNKRVRLTITSQRKSVIISEDDLKRTGHEVLKNSPEAKKEGLDHEQSNINLGILASDEQCPDSKNGP